MLINDYLTWIINSSQFLSPPHRGGCHKEKDGTDYYQTNRDSGQATDRVRGWKSGRGLWSNGVYEHHRRCGEAGDQHHGGEGE